MNSALQVSEEDISALRTKLQSGMAITVLLQDGTKLSCTLHLNPADNSLSISCEDKVSFVPSVAVAGCRFCNCVVMLAFKTSLPLFILVALTF